MGDHDDGAQGRVIQLTLSHLNEIRVVLGQLKSQRTKMRAFKEAHMAIKAVLTTKFGNRVCKCGRTFVRVVDPQAWPLAISDLDSFHPHELSKILAALRKIVVVFDNMDLNERQRGNFQTYLEIAINKEWLFKIAAVAMQQRAFRDQGKTRASTIMAVDNDSIASLGVPEVHRSFDFAPDQHSESTSEPEAAVEPPSPLLGERPKAYPPPPPLQSLPSNSASARGKNYPGENMIERRRRASEAAGAAQRLFWTSTRSLSRRG